MRASEGEWIFMMRGEEHISGRYLLHEMEVQSSLVRRFRGEM